MLNCTFQLHESEIFFIYGKDIGSRAVSGQSRLSGQCHCPDNYGVIGGLFTDNVSHTIWTLFQCHTRPDYKLRNQFTINLFLEFSVQLFFWKLLLACWKWSCPLVILEIHFSEKSDGSQRSSKLTGRSCVQAADTRPSAQNQYQWHNFHDARVSWFVYLTMQHVHQYQQTACIFTRFFSHPHTAIPWCKFFL